MSLSNTYESEEVIKIAMDTDEGRMALAQSMAEPIRRSLEYQAVGRKLLMNDDLPQGALARYERDVASVAHVIARRGAVPDQITEGEEVIVPTFELAAYPTIRLAEIKARRFYIVDRAQIKAKEALQKEEDTNIFNALNAAVDSSGQEVKTSDYLNSSVPFAAALNDAFRMVEVRDLVVTKIVMHQNSYARVRGLGKKFFDEASSREMISTGLWGHLWTADIHVSSRMVTNEILVVASPDTVGAFPIRQDITVLPADDPKRLRLGWVIYEEVGIVVVNDYSAARVVVDDETGYFPADAMRTIALS